MKIPIIKFTLAFHYQIPIREVHLIVMISNYLAIKCINLKSS